MEPNLLKDTSSVLRTEIKEIGKKVISLKNKITDGTIKMEDKSDFAEMMANVTLTYRHLEDAAMRLGKLIQSYEDGVSIYDQNDALRAANIKE